MKYPKEKKRPFGSRECRKMVEDMEIQLGIAIEALTDLDEGADFYMLNNESQARIKKAFDDIKKFKENSNGNDNNDPKKQL